MALHISILFVASLISLGCLRKAVPAALENPCGFPAPKWGWPDAAFAGSLVLFFLSMAAASAGKEPGKIDMGSLGTSLFLYAALVVMVVGFLVFRGFGLRQAFGLTRRGWGLREVGGWLLMFLPLVYFAQSLTYVACGPSQEPQPIVEFLLEAGSFPSRAAVCGLAVVAAPVTEELIFRGCVYGILRQAGGRLPAITLSSVLFALIHGHLPSLPGLLVLAVGLALVYERCGSLWAPVAMHAGFNALTIVAAVLWPEMAR